MISPNRTTIRLLYMTLQADMKQPCLVLTNVLLQAVHSTRLNHRPAESAEALHRSWDVLRPKRGWIFLDITGITQVLSPKAQ